MSFISLSFLVFLPVVTAVYFFLPVDIRWIRLLLSSIVFYMWLIPVYILVIAVLIITDYSLGILIEDNRGWQRRCYWIISLVANMGILCLFKYFNFINDTLVYIFDTLHIRHSSVFLELMLPLGLSFHVFQSLSYTTDVYRGTQKAERHLGYYALFVMVFFQMVAGPIERARHLMPQFHRMKNFDDSQAAQGLRLILWGFIQKMVIADRAAVFVNAAYGAPGNFNGLGHLIAIFLFSFQIYCDFSGYSDIAVGSAKLLNFDVIRNFERPYLSESLSEFWHRWHISLSQWFRDYLYIPLGGSHGSWVKWARNILITFLLSGLWHGADWTFVLWGLYHGICILLEQTARTCLADKKPFSGVQLQPIWRLLNTLRTFLLVTVGWVFFRAASVSQASYILRHMWQDLSHPSFPKWILAMKSFPVNSAQWVFCAAGITALLLIQITQPANGWNDWLGGQKTWLRWTSYYAGLLILVLFAKLHSQPFIYFQF